MRKYVLVAFLSASLSSLQAKPWVSPTRYSQQDTALAIQKLFAWKRLTGRIHTMSGSCYLAGGVIALPVGALGLVQTCFGLIRQTRFSRHQEAHLVSTYQAGGVLPRRIQRRLKATYFPRLT